MDWKPDDDLSYGEGRAEPYSRLARVLGASLPLFPVGGLWVRLHWSFFLAVLLFAGWTAHAAGTSDLPAWKLLVWGVAQAAILYSLVLLHEFSHAWLAALKGRPAREIVLTPLGGTAIIDRAMANPGMEAEVALAGPGLNLLALGISIMIIAGTGLPSPWAGPLTLTGALRFAFWANLMLGLFNLTPAFPLDGGRVLRALLSWRRGQRPGTRIACRVGQLAGLAFIGYGIYRIWGGGTFSWILVGIGVVNIIYCETAVRYVQMGFPVYEDALPEHGVRPPAPRETREEKRARQATELELRLDYLLAKVSRQGMRSLTFGERLFLRRASRHFRNKQRTGTERD